MTRHLIRLIWNRKRQNFLVTVEIFFSFLTLFGVLLFVVHYANNARQPLGYEIDNTWSVTVDRKENDEDPAVKARHRQTYQQILLSLRELPQVEMAAASFTCPYASWTWGSGVRLPGGREVNFGVNAATDDYFALQRMRLVAGRWFSREDDAAT
jgi:putative ABC transport system permease protein